MARGAKGASDLAEGEAERLLRALLQPDADPMQLAALMIAMRMKGETAAELAGFARALRAGIARKGAADVDIADYAGKRRMPPWYLLAALEAAQEGVRVLVHAPMRIEGRITACEAAAWLGLPVARSLDEAEALIARKGLAVLAIDGVAPQLVRLLALRARLGVRSFAHSCARLLNPLSAPAVVCGVFHAPYLARMREAAQRLGVARGLVVQGAEGAPEPWGRARVEGWDGKLSWTPPEASVPEVRYPRAPMAPEAMRAMFIEASEGRASPEVASHIARLRRWFVALAERGKEDA